MRKPRRREVDGLARSNRKLPLALEARFPTGFPAAPSVGFFYPHPLLCLLSCNGGIKGDPDTGGSRRPFFCLLRDLSILLGYRVA